MVRLSQSPIHAIAGPVSSSSSSSSELESTRSGEVGMLHMKSMDAVDFLHHKSRVSAR